MDTSAHDYSARRLGRPLLAHRLPTHLDAMGIVNQTIEDTVILRMDNVLAGFTPERLSAFSLESWPVSNRNSGRDRADSPTGRSSVRERDLPAHVVVYYVIALALYMRSSYREVLPCLLKGVRWLLVSLDGSTLHVADTGSSRGV